MVKKQHKRGFRQDDWMDPLHLNVLLTEEEELIKKTDSNFLFIVICIAFTSNPCWKVLNSKNICSLVNQTSTICTK